MNQVVKNIQHSMGMNFNIYLWIVGTDRP